MKPWVKTAVAGVGFLSDAYDLFIIDVVKNVMAELYPQTVGDAAAISTAALVGAVLGQLTFGALADVLGRRVIFITTLSFVLLGCFGSATASAGGVVGVYAQLAIWRFILGFGVGGEYPLSATITSESSTAKGRGVAMAAVFSMQGVGKLLAAAVNAACLSSGMPLDTAWRAALFIGGIPGALTLYHRWKLEESHVWTESSRGVADGSASPVSRVKSVASSDEHVERGGGDEGGLLVSQRAGRDAGGGGYGATLADDAAAAAAGTLDVKPVSLSPLAPHQGYAGGGSAPPPIAAPHPPVAVGVKLPAAVRRCIGPAAATSVEATLGILYEQRFRLCGTAGNWFLLDITFYGQGLFSGTVLGIAGFTTSTSSGSHSRAELLDLATGSLLLVSIALPGYLVATLLIDRMGRRPMQLMGFAACAVVFSVLGAGLQSLRGQYKALFVFLYGLTFFFSNFGANMTTFILPAEIFPTRARATCHGISAAAGKLGAVLGSSGMPPLLVAYGTDAESKEKGLQTVMYVCAVVSLLGLMLTYVLTPESKGQELEALALLPPGGVVTVNVPAQLTKSLAVLQGKGERAGLAPGPAAPTPKHSAGSGRKGVGEVVPSRHGGGWQADEGLEGGQGKTAAGGDVDWK